ncbi:hypothetical protein ACFP50_35715, partial [Streptomyces pratens]
HLKDHRKRRVSRIRAGQSTHTYGRRAVKTVVDEHTPTDPTLQPHSAPHRSRPLRHRPLNWWEGHGFLLSLASSLTSLRFGVPTALLVLSHLGNAQADARQTRRARALAVDEIREFREALVEAFHVSDTAELASKAVTMQVELRELRLQPNPDRIEATARFLNGLNDLLREPGRR